MPDTSYLSLVSKSRMKPRSIKSSRYAMEEVVFSDMEPLEWTEEATTISDSWRVMEEVVPRSNSRSVVDKTASRTTNSRRVLDDAAPKTNSRRAIINTPSKGWGELAARACALGTKFKVLSL